MLNKINDEKKKPSMPGGLYINHLFFNFLSLIKIKKNILDVKLIIW